MKQFSFDAIIIKHPTLNSGYIEIPDEIMKEFGDRHRIKVKAMFNGFEYRGLIVKMGLPNHCIGINQQVRKAIGKNPGDKISVTIEEDLEERAVSIPDDFNQSLTQFPETFEKFNKLSYTHKKEYVNWISEAKRPETRKNRIEKAITMINV
ncbi:MAG TPA: YdeI/OmpD-associated family protein [Candidatus Kapabacteria bacterium]|nr:YdeI/OmpD-associated family protein [Candidatus Kapabacteria bacterium]HPO61453.1 YdeI/OmpD-associated family protein [Candidatus Kapabacteria bacterium]